MVNQQRDWSKANKLRQPYLARMAKGETLHCHLCNGPIDPEAKYPAKAAFTLDHLEPLAHGGRYQVANMAPAHADCNKRRQEARLDQIENYGTMNWRVSAGHLGASRGFVTGESAAMQSWKRTAGSPRESLWDTPIVHSGSLNIPGCECAGCEARNEREGFAHPYTGKRRGGTRMPSPDREVPTPHTPQPEARLSGRAAIEALRAR